MIEYKFEPRALGKKNQMTYVKCNKCGENFSVFLKERNGTKNGKFSKIRYFNCPHCKAEYIVCKYDKKGEIVKD